MRLIVAFVHRGLLSIADRQLQRVEEAVELLYRRREVDIGKQAEWIRAISSARGFFRNSPPPRQLPPAAEENDDIDEEDEPPKADWVKQLQPIVATVVQQLIATIMGPKKHADAQKLEVADMLDWRRAAAKHDSGQLAHAGTEPTLDPLALQQALAGKALAIGALLEPHERARLMKLAPMLSKLAGDPEISKMLSELVAMSVEDSAAWVRAHLDEIEKGVNPWRLQAWLGHKRIDETMLYVHVAEAHPRELPEPVQQAACTETDPDRRILAMLGARGKTVAKSQAVETETKKSA